VVPLLRVSRLERVAPVSTDHRGPTGTSPVTPSIGVPVPLLKSCYPRPGQVRLTVRLRVAVRPAASTATTVPPMSVGGSADPV